MSDYECPNCGQEFTQEEVDAGDGVYSDSNSDPYTGITQDDYFCSSCADEYRDDTDLLRRIFAGKVDRINFKLRKKRDEVS